MSEPYELIDDAEMALYSVVYKQLKRQKKEILDNPELFKSDAFWEKERRLMTEAMLPLIQDMSEDAIRNALADIV